MAIADRAGWGGVHNRSADLVRALDHRLARADDCGRVDGCGAMVLTRRPAGHGPAIGVFLFVLTYKLGDASMGPMVVP